MDVLVVGGGHVGVALAANEMVVGSKAHLDKSVFLCNHDIAGAS